MFIHAQSGALAKSFIAKFWTRNTKYMHWTEISKEKLTWTNEKTYSTKIVFHLYMQSSLLSFKPFEACCILSLWKKLSLILSQSGEEEVTRCTRLNLYILTWNFIHWHYFFEIQGLNLVEKTSIGYAFDLPFLRIKKNFDLPFLRKFSSNKKERLESVFSSKRIKIQSVYTRLSVI